MFSQASRPGERLEAAHKVKKLSQIRGAQLPHSGSSVRKQFDQSLGRQDLQRFAQRRARNRKHLAKLTFGNARAAGKIALDDIVAQARQDLVVQRGGGPAIFGRICGLASPTGDAGFEILRNYSGHHRY